MPLPYNPAITPWGHLFQKKMKVQKPIHECLYFICSSPTWKQTKRPFFKGQMEKQTVIHSYHGLLLSNTREHTIRTRNNLDGSQENDAE